MSGTRWWIWAVALSIGAVAVGAPALRLAGVQEQPFPHRAHQGLFPLCTGCHEGVPTGDLAAFYPEPASCAGCHDGVREAVVSWQGPAETIDNVRYEHGEHARELTAAGDAPQDCATCHIEPGGERMAVAPEIQLAACWTCHEATDHQVDADCTVCHQGLAETRFDRARIAALPTPADHDAAAFLNEQHGRLVQDGIGRCATCHTRERCVACHVDVDVQAIAAMPGAPPAMELPEAGAHYNTPATHVVTEWSYTHGAGASRETCATCHTSNDCASCHIDPVPSAVATLPARSDVAAPGVMLAARAPESHGSFFFMRAHGTLAASGDATCASCHEERYCVGCHDGPADGGYHPPDFVARHAADAFGQDAECGPCGCRGPLQCVRP